MPCRWGVSIPACLAGLQAHTQGGSWGISPGGSPGPHPGESPGPCLGGSQHALTWIPWADCYCCGGTHPTGMHSCSFHKLSITSVSVYVIGTFWRTTKKRILWDYLQALIAACDGFLRFAFGALYFGPLIFSSIWANPTALPAKWVFFFLWRNKYNMTNTMNSLQCSMST